MNSKLNISQHNLIIFLKNPLPGKVKTRLAAEIGNIRAAKIYRDIAEEVVSKCTDSPKYSSTISYYPPESIEMIKKWLKNINADFVPQSGHDLGSRMLNAFNNSFNLGYVKTIIIGSDCVDVDKRLIEEAFDQLNENEVVIGPSADGGYYLIGLKKPLDAIFKKMRWSTSQVLNETIKRLNWSGIKYHMLERLNDIDTLDDLKKHIAKIGKKKIFNNTKLA